MNIGIVACSNGLSIERREQIEALIKQLENYDMHAICSPHLYAENGVAAGTAVERARVLMDFYRDESIGAIFDVSGGDIANEILPHLDYAVIANARKPFWGYSDLTTIINAIYACSNVPSVLYQVRNLVKDRAEVQQMRFAEYAAHTDRKGMLFDLRYEFLRGREMGGIIIGGNVRCLLKLAGTPFWPDMKDKILFLEALGGDEGSLRTYFAQLEQLGAFRQIAGILLGTFTRFEESQAGMTVYEILEPHLPKDLPVAKTPDIGHGSDAKAIEIGAYIELRNMETPGI